jgi:LPS sulfotransferase NodH
VTAESRFTPPGGGRKAEDSCYDAAEPVDVHTSILMAMEHRSGSTLLSWGLWSTGLAGLPYEYLIPMRMGPYADRWGAPRPTMRGRLGRIRRRRSGGPDHYLRFQPRSYGDFVDRLARYRATPNGVFSMKTTYPDFTIHLDAGHDHTAFPGHIVWVRLRRHDMVRQAISRFRASHTRRYQSDQPSGTDPAYDRGSIDHHLRRLVEDRSNWTAYLESRHVPYLDLWYEEFTEDFEGTLAAVFDHADIDHPDGWPAAPLAPIADDLTEKWVQRYRSGR